jgi:DNA helicase-2/ATP-dependent DNA helicase PcrA
MTGTSDVLAGLNPAQREAVEAVEGPVLVLAGPGSGKTRVLTHRVAYLVKGYGVAPWQIMAVTFTNKAAREMKERLYRLLGEEFRKLTIGTFHAICARILRREAGAAHISPRYVIYDGGDQLSLARKAIRALNLDDKRFRPQAMLRRISQAKNELMTPDDMDTRTYRDEIARRVYEQYQAMLVENGALDFDDLLMRTVHVFQQNGEVRTKYQRRYPFILVDEWQDTNMAQYELVKLLAGERANLFVVGDEDQSIYRFRGADYRNVARFREDYPQARVILLERNYRSTQTILDLANAVIARNMHRHPKRLYTEKGSGPQIRVVEAYDEQEEGDMIVSEIQRLVARDEAQLGDFAVMYRTNAQSRPIEDAFVRRGMPYKLVGATRFYERREIKDVMAYLRLIHNPYDSVGLLRIINVPTRGIGQKTLSTLEGWAAKMGVPLYAALQILAEAEGAEAETGSHHPFSTRATGALLSFTAIIEELSRARQAMNLLELLDLLLGRTGYAAYVQDGTDEGQIRWENILELRTVARDYAGLAPDVALTTFLEEVALVSDVDNLDEKMDAPTLLTLHAAKGLEFPVVLIAGMEEGLFPHSRSMDDPEQMDEERRLCYVGVTRAKERLYLLYTFRRTLYGENEVREPSRFLADVPEGLVAGPAGKPAARQQGLGLGAGRFLGRTRTTTRPFSPTMRPGADAANRPQPAVQRFQTGDEVEHTIFGKGVVIDSKVSGGDEQVTVAFAGVGLKRLMVSMAPLQKIEG